MNIIRFGVHHLDWNLDDMLHALSKELDVLEGHIPILKPQSGNQMEKEKSLTSQRPRQQTMTTSALFTEDKTNGGRKCVFCLEEHSSENCQTVKGQEERKNILLKHTRCFLCLGGGHRYFQCRSKLTGANCKGKHHVSICRGNGCVPAAPIAKESQPKSSSASTLNVHAASWVGSTSSGDRVALQTALAKVNGKKGNTLRVLFDTGNQKTFISAKAVNRLGEDRKTWDKAFGRNEADVAMRDVYNFSVEPLRGGKSVSIDAFVVNDFSTIANERVEIIKKKFSHLSYFFFLQC